MAQTRFPQTTLDPSLYERDETAWLEQHGCFVAERRFDELDAEHLSEYLLAMARRDRREVCSRLTVLMTHLLKWRYQHDKRTSGWRVTILDQRDELEDLLESRTLERHAEKIFAHAYDRARTRAAAGTGLDESTFAGSCPWSLDHVLRGELPA